MKNRDWFKDYKKLPDVNHGKGSWEYCGKYYEFGLTQPLLARLLRILLLISSFQLIITVLMGLANNPGSRKFSIVIPYLGMMIAAVTNVWNAAALYSANGKLTERIYKRNYLWLFRGTIILIILACVEIVSESVFVLRGAELLPELLMIIGSMLIAALAALQRKNMMKHRCKQV